MRSRLLERLSDVRSAIRTLPDAQTWLHCLVVYAVFLACALPLGFVSGFLRPEVATFSRSMFVLLPLYMFLRPALVEELVFRALLLPRGTNGVRRGRLIVVSILALAVFVVSHPLHGWLTRPEALELFTSPIFLVFATLLGIACTVTYLISRSLWPPVLLHWMTVLIWITLLGGQRVMGSRLQNAQPVATAEASLAAGTEQFAGRLSQSDEFSGVVLLSRNGKPLVRRAFGFADREKQRRITVDTPFALASVSKMFTAVVVGQLVEHKKISLDATVGSLLPAYPGGPSSSQVRVRHLLSMSSGIPDLFRSPQFFAEIDKIRKPSDFWRFFATSPLEFPPGSKWTYSNSNFLVLGAIVERVTGEPFAATVEKQVFVPAGLQRTSYRPRFFPDVAMGYTHNRPGSAPGGPADPDHWYPAWEAKFGSAGDDTSDFVVGAPMGGGVSTGEDLTRFAEALMRGKLLSPEMTERMTSPESPAADYGGRDGLGFEMLTLNGVRIVGHRGGFPGIANQIEFYPDHGFVLVILGNSDSDGTERIAKHVRTAITDSSLLSKR